MQVYIQVYIQDKNGNPLMPTKRFGAVRRWLKSGRAVVVRREPFTIRLVDREDGYTQALEAGIDLGTAHVGVSVVSDEGEVFAGEYKLRTDIGELLTQRRTFRRSRRGRKTRYRPARFLNRKHKDELAPSVRAKIDETLKVIALVQSILPIAHWTFEIGNFDPHRLANPDVKGEGYRRGEQYGFANVREYVLHRDRHTCQNPKCSGNDPVLTVHHIRERSEGGSDRPANLVTLCKTCHHAHHSIEPLKLKTPSALRDATQLNIVKSYIMRATIPSAFGFKRGDRVRMQDGCEGFIYGLRSSGYFDVRRLDGEVLSHSVSYKKLQRLEIARTLRIERSIAC